MWHYNITVSFQRSYLARKFIVPFCVVLPYINWIMLRIIGESMHTFFYRFKFIIRMFCTFNINCILPTKCYHYIFTIWYAVNSVQSVYILYILWILSKKNEIQTLKRFRVQFAFFISLSMIVILEIKKLYPTFAYSIPD